MGNKNKNQIPAEKPETKETEEVVNEAAPEETTEETAEEAVEETPEETTEETAEEVAQLDEAAPEETTEEAAEETAEEAAENTGPSDLLIERVEAAAKAKGASIKMMREVYFAIESDPQKRVNLIKAGDTAAARDIVKNAAEKFLKECGKK